MTKYNRKSADEARCPFCESNQLKMVERTQEISDRSGNTIVVPGYESTSCVECGNEFVTAVQAKANDRHVVDGRRVSQKLLPTDEIRRIRRRLGLTQDMASQIFGGGRNAFSKYERGDVSQSVAMDRLIRAVDYSPKLLPFLYELAGVEFSSRSNKPGERCGKHRITRHAR